MTNLEDIDLSRPSHPSDKFALAQKAKIYPLPSWKGRQNPDGGKQSQPSSISFMFFFRYLRNKAILAQKLLGLGRQRRYLWNLQSTKAGYSH